jgi:pyrroline-5-carboxylate reductase
MILGFIGTGKITTALAEGFSTCHGPPEKIIISPRNAQRANDLAQKFDLVQIGQNNQDVVDQSDVVFLALRPETAREALSPLIFKKTHIIISLIPTMPLGQIAAFVNPAHQICRAVPLPSVARQDGPILLFQGNEPSEQILSLVGKPVKVSEEDQLHVLWAMNGMISPVFEMMAVLRDWAVLNDVDKDLAQIYTARFVLALAGQALANPNTDFSSLAHEAATPGGLNEQALEMIRKLKGYESFRSALDAVLLRFGK